MFWLRFKKGLNREITLRRLTLEGDTAVKVQLKTLVKEKIETVPYLTIINGKTVNSWDELLDEANKTPNPQVLQIPRIVGG